MIRHLYSLIFWLALPLVIARLFVRARKAPAYKQRIKERFGLGPPRHDRPLWIHAVSVGETLAIAPLVRLLIKKHPELPIIMTTMTPTGAERVRALFGAQVEHRYCPYDLPLFMRHFLKQVKPRGLIIVETELWPNLVHCTAHSNTPIILANARLSARSARGYQRFRCLTRPMLTQLTRVAAQNQTTAQRFRDLGLTNKALSITGNIKFDLDLPEGKDGFVADLRKKWGGDRPVLIAGSTHQGEDEAIINGYIALKKQWPTLLLILVPRHPERFKHVENIAIEQGLNCTKRSTSTPSSTTDVYLGDTMGELLPLYACADIAFVGGSLNGGGGHNPLEPASLSKPVLMGTGTFNFTEICQQLQHAGGLTLVENKQQLVDKISELLSNDAARSKEGAAAAAVVKQNQGALQQLYLLVCNDVLSTH